jgi:hypothetical protein
MSEWFCAIFPGGISLLSYAYSRSVDEEEKRYNETNVQKRAGRAATQPGTQEVFYLRTQIPGRRSNQRRALKLQQVSTQRAPTTKQGTMHTRISSARRTRE